MHADDRDILEQNLVSRRSSHSLLRRGRSLIAFIALLVAAHLEYILVQQLRAIGFLQGALAILYPIVLSALIVSLLRDQTLLEATHERALSAEMERLDKRAAGDV